MVFIYFHQFTGGHPFSFTGVFEITPRDHDELGEQFRFRYFFLYSNSHHIFLMFDQIIVHMKLI